MNKTGLYIHIPFCKTKCPYCDFYSLCYNEKIEQDYINAVIDNIKQYDKKGIVADTLYFGGGTPTIINPESVEKIIKTAKQVFGLDGEITIEANPNSITNDKIKSYKKAGINRVSIGMQSANQNELDALGRTHNLKQVENAINIIKQNEINNISVDLMLGTPHQTIKSLNKTFEFIKMQPITHVSAYMLKIEQGTVFYETGVEKDCPDEDLTSELYLYSVEKLNDMGFKQYEISNFSKSGFESRHNLKYWRCEDYLGFGASAHSCFENKRFYFLDDINEYIASKGENIIIEDENANNSFDYIMLKLRLNEGINLKHLEKHYKIKADTVLKFALPYIKNGLIKQESETLSLTKNGFLLQNSIVAALLYYIESQE